MGPHIGKTFLHVFILGKILKSSQETLSLKSSNLTGNVLN
jgi:hypothetical protein